MCKVYLKGFLFLGRIFFSVETIAIDSVKLNGVNGTSALNKTKFVQKSIKVHILFSFTLHYTLHL